MTWMDGAGRVKRTLSEDEAALAYARKVEKKAGFDRALEEIIHVAEMDERYEEFIASQEPEGERHYGVWHPDQGWWFETSGMLFVATNRALAKAQCDIIQRWGAVPEVKELYCVRCIEEWADES